MKALPVTQPSMRSSPLSAGLASMRKLAVHFNYEEAWHKMWTLTIMSDTSCILTYSGHRGSTPLFITNWVEVLHHFNSVCHPHKSDKSFTFFIHLSKSGTHMLYIQYIPAQNSSHSSSGPSLHFYASCSFAFTGIKFWMVITEFWLLRILMLKFFETRAYV
jgi:hypothetical protein